MREELKKAGLTGLKLLNEEGYEAWWVGGCVRDSLLDRPVDDIDITTSALPEQVIRCFKDRGYTVVPTGIRHGTVTVLIDKIPLEITVYRCESDYRDHRHPSSVLFVEDLKLDCSRRDFTINALCWHPETGIKDFFGGKTDLENRIIRCIGDPRVRIDEDALRILRAVRFSSVLDFDIDPETSAALFEKKNLLKILSAERIAAEIRKMVTGVRFPAVFCDYHELLEVLFPQLPALQSPARIQKTIAILDRSARNTLVRLGCLFVSQDDLPLCEQQAQLFASTLKFSNQDKKNLIQLVHNQDRQLHCDPVCIRELLHDLPDIAFELVQFRYACGKLEESEKEKLLEVLEISRETECYSLKQLAVNGHDLKEMHCPAKQISTLLNETLDLVIHDQLPNDREKLICYCADRVKNQ